MSDTEERRASVGTVLDMLEDLYEEVKLPDSDNPLDMMDEPDDDLQFRKIIVAVMKLVRKNEESLVNDESYWDSLAGYDKVPSWEEREEEATEPKRQCPYCDGEGIHNTPREREASQGGSVSCVVCGGSGQLTN